MSADKVTRIEELLSRAGEAHHKFETEALKGVRDEKWALWYAGWLVDNGLHDVVAARRKPEEWAKVLTRLAEEHKKAGTDQPWNRFYAAGIVRELG